MSSQKKLLLIRQRLPLLLLGLLSSSLSWLLPSLALGAEYHGRLNIGLLAARERFTTEPEGSNSNDVGVVSSRLFLDVSKISAQEFQFVLDLRDKHDFFDKLDREQLELTSRNRLQAKQLYVRSQHADQRLFATLGRFSAGDAGSIYTDGADLGLRLGNDFKGGVFGGYAPKIDESGALETRSGAEQYGAYFTYSDFGRKWSEYTYFSNVIASVPEETNPPTSNEVDPALAPATSDPTFFRRSMWLNNTTVQWGQKARLTNYSWVHVGSKPIAENVWTSWHQNHSSMIKSQLSYLHVDPTEYHRQQDLRETLPSSQYRQGSLSIKHSVTPTFQLFYGGKYGKRSLDDLQRKSLRLGAYSTQVFGPKATTGLFVDYVQGFVANSITTTWDYSYFTSDWEFHLSQALGLEKHRDKDKTLHPSITQLGSSFFWSRMVFSTLSLEWARDEEVNIYSLIAKVGYRFGSKELPPIRDGAPPRGRL